MFKHFVFGFVLLEEKDLQFLTTSELGITIPLTCRIARDWGIHPQECLD